ncbi:MAG: N-acetylmuramoyl-L-alanine amidase, partial [Desulfitobacteriaceae bacterium]
AIGLALRNDLLSRNIDVVMTRTTDVTVGINDRFAIANNNNVDVFVSTHCNSSTDSSVYGSTVLYPNNHDTSYSQTIANLVEDQIYSNTFLYTYTTPYSVGSSIGVLYYTQMPAILTETGFMSNSSDLGNLINSSNQTSIGQAISYGIWYWLWY